MSRVKNFKRYSLVFIVIVDVVLFSSIFFLMNYVQQLLDSDAKINLTEIVTQNKDVITSNLMMEVNNVELVSNQLSERLSQNGEIDWNAMQSVFLRYEEEKGDERLFLAFPDGQAYFPDGQTIDVSGRNYFKLAIKGKRNISERTVSRQDGNDIFVISVPLICENKVIGTVQKQYTLQEMYDLCSISLFTDQGFMYIINSQGYILVSSDKDAYSRESDNYYRMLYLDNPEESKRLESDLQDGFSGFMEMKLEGKKYFCAYTPVDEIYDWYLISSVATDAVSPNGAVVIRMFYVVLLAAALLFAFSMVYFERMKRKQRRHLEHVAFFDAVTEGDTYTRFIYEMPKLLKEVGDRQSFIFAFDIDNFKYINTVYGFDAGDRILKAVYGFYKSKLTSGERIARNYSDHFVVFLEEASENRLNWLFNSEISLEGIPVYLSAGLYAITDVSESVNLMVDKATMAARKIKGMRYKRVEIYSEAFDEEMIRSEKIKRSMEQALADGEIIPYFQPKVNINTLELVGAEALARWKTKEGKLIPPGEFIPVCEKNGLIVSIDLAIFEKTLQFIRKSLDQGIACVPISVNFSRIHMYNKDFLNMLLGKLNEYKVPPHLIELELTETVIFDNYQKMEELIDQLHANGLQVSMDDFGSGYSSLHMIKDIDIDVLKIDRGFLKDTARSERQKAVFAAVAEMAERLKIDVVVEGVETIENVQLMQEFGCTVAQGFFYAKPMSEEDFEKVYREGKLC